MAQHEPTAAQALYGHLRSNGRPEIQGRRPTLANALWPSLARPEVREAPKRESAEVSLATLADENPWLEARLAMAGIRRVRR